MSRTRAEARDYMQPARYLKLVVAGFSPTSAGFWGISVKSRRSRWFGWV